MTPVFITGIGTDVGKTLVAAIVTKALGADYWKPIQAGGLDNTDTHVVKKLAGEQIRVWPETYRLLKPASPHISAREEGISIDLEKIFQDYIGIQKDNNYHLVIEGAGGLLVPLNDTQTVADLVKKLNTRVVIVSRNYLGSINHSLLTAAYCQKEKLNVAGWIFTDEYMGYEEEISSRTGYPVIGKIPFLDEITDENISIQAKKIRPSLLAALNKQA